VTTVPYANAAINARRDAKQTWTADSLWLALGVTSVEAIGVPFSEHSLSNAFTDFSNPRYFKYCTIFNMRTQFEFSTAITNQKLSCSRVFSLHT